MALARVMIGLQNGVLTKPLQPYNLKAYAIANAFWKNFPRNQDITAVQQNYLPDISPFLKIIFTSERQLPENTARLR
jgi:hypothetical protein